MVKWLPFLAIVAVSACEPAPCDGSMIDSPGGLVVTPVEHPTGWGEANCEECHVADVTHTRGCTPDVDLDAIRAKIDAEGPDVCVECHGDNGRSE
jgi:hypothetical protein